jgi:hypothetical protein
VVGDNTIHSENACKVHLSPSLSKILNQVQEDDCKRREVVDDNNNHGKKSQIATALNSLIPSRNFVPIHQIPKSSDIIWATVLVM